MQFIIIPKKKIERKFHRYTMHMEMEMARYPNWTSIIDFRDKILLKKAPKYLKSFRLYPWEDLKSIQALKKVKRIDYLLEENDRWWERSKVKQLRLILRNQFKTIQKYRPNTDEMTESLKKYRACSNLNKVQLYNPAHASHPKYKEDFSKFLLKVMRYLPGMANLKFLDIEIKYKEDLVLLKKLNSMPHILSSLKTLRVEYRIGQSWDGMPILPLLIKYENILRYITCLHIGRLAKEQSQDIFELLPKCCKNLTSLSFRVCSKKLMREVSFRPKYLKVIENFEKLEALRISVEDVLGFISTFTAPRSLKYLEIAFDDANWSEICEEFLSINIDEFVKEKSVEELFQNSEKLARFFKQWSQFNNLVSLRISAWSFPGTMAFILSFVASLLTKITRLQHFEFTARNCPENWTERSIIYNNCVMDLSSIFNSLINVSEKLKSFKLSLPEQYLVSSPTIKDGLNFPNLTSFQLSKNNIIDLATIRNLFRMLKKPLFLESLSDRLEIRLATFFSNSNEDLVDLFEMLRKPPRNTKIELSLMITAINVMTFDKIFYPLIQKAKNTLPRVKNVLLTAGINPKIYARVDNLFFLLVETFKSLKFMNEKGFPIIDKEDGFTFKSEDEDGIDNHSEDKIEEESEEESEEEEDQYNDYLEIEDGSEYISDGEW